MKVEAALDVKLKVAMEVEEGLSRFGKILRLGLESCAEVAAVGCRLALPSLVEVVEEVGCLRCCSLPVVVAGLREFYSLRKLEVLHACLALLLASRLREVSSVVVEEVEEQRCFG